MENHGFFTAKKHHSLPVSRTHACFASHWRLSSYTAARTRGTPVTPETFSSGYGLTELGTFSNGAFNLSRFVLTQNRSSVDSASAAGTTAEAFSGSDGAAYGNPTFTGNRTVADGTQLNSTESDSLSQEGTYQYSATLAVSDWL